MTRIRFWVGILLAALLFTVPLSAQLTGPTTSGLVALDGSNPTSVTTGLATLTACTVAMAKNEAPGVTTSVFTVRFTPTGGRLDIYAWKVTSSSDTTLIASTATGDNISYICTGTTN